MKQTIQQTASLGKEYWGLRIITTFIFFTVTFCLVQVATSEQTKQIVAGAGPSTQIVTKFIGQLSATDSGKTYKFIVPRNSEKHAGGIKNVLNTPHIFGRTGRPLNEKERSKGIDEIFVAKMPIVFVVGKEAGIKELSISQVCGIFSGEIKNWKDVGGADHRIKVFSREPTEALFLTLKNMLPCMKNVTGTAFIYRKEPLLLRALRNPRSGGYAIGFGAYLYFPEEYIVKIDKFDVGVNMGLVYNEINDNHPLVKEAKKLAKGDSWKKFVVQENLLQAD